MFLFSVLAVVGVLGGDWEFRKTLDADTNEVNDAWRTVSVPHDWAIAWPFAPNLKGGWTGALPWRGAGEYRRTFALTGPGELVAEARGLRAAHFGFGETRKEKER